MYDGSREIFERMRFIDASFTVPILPDGRILLTLQEQPTRRPFISLPGGGFDFPEEDPLICAKRELMEETGYESDDWDFWHTYEGTDNVIVFTHFYIAHDCTLVRDIHPDPGEKITLLTRSFDEFLLLSEDPLFTHWTLLPHLFRARLHPEYSRELKKKFRL